MKRQRSTGESRPPARKAKRREEEKAVAAVEEEEKKKRECRREHVAAEEEAEARWWSAADEQMSWGAFWCPSWDIEYLAGEAYNTLYSDVAWDDDIWDLRAINQVPN
ncbi:uncharacterized protein LOC127806619 [Diospyros lotus]|uniref:uncharacterized protein LOC127806619 n=1 Tax=Diospyros lotus TaxID=55363 RepID=UPI00224D9F1F|nr:uncharacterized protein LOC127806619 [Diospyros lotus]